MLSPLLNTFFTFTFTAFIMAWIIALLVDRFFKKDGIPRWGLLVIALVAIIAASAAACGSWHRGEFRQDQQLEIDYEAERE